MTREAVLTAIALLGLLGLGSLADYTAEQRVRRALARSEVACETRLAQQELDARFASLNASLKYLTLSLACPVTETEVP